MKRVLKENISKNVLVVILVIIAYFPIKD